MTKYYAKFPEEPFKIKRKRYFRSIAAAKAEIEKAAWTYYFGYPWIQLVAEDSSGWKVLAEFKNHDRRGWVSAFQAAGLE